MTRRESTTNDEEIQAIEERLSVLADQLAQLALEGNGKLVPIAQILCAASTALALRDSLNVQGNEKLEMLATLAEGFSRQTNGMPLMPTVPSDRSGDVLGATSCVQQWIDRDAPLNGMVLPISAVVVRAAPYLPQAEELWPACVDSNAPAYPEPCRRIQEAWTRIRKGKKRQDARAYVRAAWRLLGMPKEEADNLFNHRFRVSRANS